MRPADAVARYKALRQELEELLAARRTIVIETSEEVRKEYAEIGRIQDEMRTLIDGVLIDPVFPKRGGATSRRKKR